MKEKRELYFNVVLGVLGITLIGLGALRYNIHDDLNGFGILLFGFIFTHGYINYLEKKAGVNRKIVWIRKAISAVFILLFGYILYL